VSFFFVHYHRLTDFIYALKKDKAEVTRKLLEAAKKSKNITNTVFLSSAGCDYAERDAQPRLREFIDLELDVMQPKQDSSTGDTGHSPCIIRYVRFSSSTTTPN
jgi:hypothetical protein